MPKRKPYVEPPKPPRQSRELCWPELNERHTHLMEAFRLRAAETFGVTVMGPNVALRFSTTGKAPDHNLVVVSGIVTEIYDGVPPVLIPAVEYNLEDPIALAHMSTLATKAVQSKSFLAAHWKGAILTLGFTDETHPSEAKLIVSVRIVVTSITDSNELEPEEEDK
jgi:hypothetical protein